MEERLQKILSRHGVASRREAEELIQAGRVTVNGRVAKASVDVKVGDEIAIAFGNKETKVRVLSLQESVRKEDAENMFEYI